jgi:hypothetical protein
VLRDLGQPGLVDQLVDLSGADLTTVLLEVMEQRAARLSPADVAARYAEDRFVQPGVETLGAILEAEALLLGALPDSFDQIVLSPVTPIGSHSTVGRVSQNNMVSTVRRTDVAGDPTVGLALEAAARRAAILADNPKSAEAVRLASVQRVVRAQHFEGPIGFSHFTLLGLVTAGRDTGGSRFETEAMIEHCAVLGRALLVAGSEDVLVSVTDWTNGTLASVAAAVEEQLDDPRSRVAEEPERERAHGYYQDGAIRIDVTFGSATFEVADGGLVDWTQQLVGSAKERMMISGIGVDRVAIARCDRG